jgi:iron(III) transport system substrate-binding protein
MFEKFLASLWIGTLVTSLTWPVSAPAQITPEVIEAAKKEGEVMLYGAITINSSKAVGDAFEKKYGVKLRHWRGDAATDLRQLRRICFSSRGRSQIQERRERRPDCGNAAAEQGGVGELEQKV